MSINLHIHESALSNNSRDLKEAESVITAGLADEVVLVGRLGNGLEADQQAGKNIRILRLPQSTRRLPRNKFLALIKIAEATFRYVRAIRALRPKSIHCHSLSPLGACVLAKRLFRIPLIYDAHELETERNGLRGVNKRVDRWTERLLIRHCDAVLCVSDSIADWYARTYKIRRPVVVRNVPNVPACGRPEATPGLWRERFGIPAAHIVFIYQGGLFRGRRIEQFLRVFAEAKPDRHIVFMGYGEMQETIEEAARKHSNIHYAPAVRPHEVLRHTAGADVGLVGVENVCLSYYYSLPNKLFEFLLAGIPALMPRYPEMVRVTEGYGCGWVVGEQDADWLAEINAITPERIAAGREAARAAGDGLSWQNEAVKLTSVYRELLQTNQAA